MKGDENIYIYIIISNSSKKTFIGQRDDFRDSLCVQRASVPSSGAARANTCEFEVMRGKRIQMYASRTLIQDCASKSREERRWARRWMGRFFCGGVSPGSWDDPEVSQEFRRVARKKSKLPLRRATATPGIHSAADVGRHLGIDIR